MAVLNSPREINAELDPKDLPFPPQLPRDIAAIKLVLKDLNRAEYYLLAKGMTVEWDKDDRLYLFRMPQAFWEGSSEPRVGIVGGFSETGNLYIIDAYRGIWSSHNTIEAVIHALRKWPIRRIGLGETESAVLLAPGLEAKAREVGFSLPVDWLPVKRNMESRIKSVESLQSLFMMNKVWFNADMPHLDHLFNEFSRFPKYKYSQIPEAVAMLSQHYRGSSQELQNPNLYENPEIVVSCVHSMFGDLQQQRDAEGYGDGELGGGLVG